MKTFKRITKTLIVSMLFLSCSENEDNEVSQTIQINNVAYTLSNIVEHEGYYDQRFNNGQFTITTEENSNIEYFMFKFENDSRPISGDDFSKMNLRLNLEIIEGTIYTYESGSAIITNIDESSNRIHIAFNNLKMKHNNFSYVFSGKVHLPYDNSNL